MTKGGMLLLVVTTILLSTIVCSINVSAADDKKSAVGVLNVGPSGKITEINSIDDEFRVDLTISDYNSHDDIHKVEVILEYYGSETAKFTFKQYADATSYVKTNTFSEKSTEGKLLLKEKCTYYSSPETESVEDRCNLELRFVFHATWFTNLNIIVYDRAGLTATFNVEYDTDAAMRSSNMVMIPWLDGPILVGISSFVINLIAIVLGALGALYFAKKMNILRIVNYEKT